MLIRMRSVSVNLGLVSNWLQSQRAHCVCLSGSLQATVMLQRHKLQELSDSFTRNPRNSEFTDVANTLTYIREFLVSILVWDTNYTDILSAISEVLQTNSDTVTRLKSRTLPFQPVTN